MKKFIFKPQKICNSRNDDLKVDILVFCRIKEINTKRYFVTKRIKYIWIVYNLQKNSQKKDSLTNAKWHKCYLMYIKKKMNVNREKYRKKF